MDLKVWLESNGLGKYAELFAANEIDFDLLLQLTKSDLDELGLPVGAWRRLAVAIESFSKYDLQKGSRRWSNLPMPSAAN